MDVAITVDDLPENGEVSLNSTRLEIANKMLRIFQKHHISGIYGFINASHATDKNNLILLQSWIEQGNFIGNHTYSHVDLSRTNSDEYIFDIQRNEPLLIQLSGDVSYQYFRYPYLSEGNTQEKRDTVRQFLFLHQYKIVPVTVDFFEYEWNDPYVRCLNIHDEKSIQWLKTTYIEQSLNALDIAHALSIYLFKRDIKNILIIHMNEITAELLDDLISAYENRGITFISLKEALTDPVYSLNPNIVRNRTYTFLNQIRLERELENPEKVTKLYNTLPEERLANICKDIKYSSQH